MYTVHVSSWILPSLTRFLRMCWELHQFRPTSARSSSRRFWAPMEAMDHLWMIYIDGSHELPIKAQMFHSYVKLPKGIISVA